MREVRERLVHEVLGNPLLVDLASDLIYRGIKGYLAQGNDQNHRPKSGDEDS